MALVPYISNVIRCYRRCYRLECLLNSFKLNEGLNNIAVSSLPLINT